MQALAYLAQDILGANTYAYGAAVTPTGTPSMNVNVAAGRLYTMAALEPTQISSLVVDTTSVLKQGIYAGGVFGFIPPTTAGQSQNWLIECQYQDVDDQNNVLMYWNSLNPAQPYSGAGNNGLSQPTRRQSLMAVQLKAGVPATTGTQTSPSADTGWFPLAVVTVANGATSLTSTNITQATGHIYAPISATSTGNFTGTATGLTTGPTGVVYWRQSGSIVTLTIPVLTGTSNSTSFGMTGLPAALWPAIFGANQQVPLCLAQNSGAAVAGAYAQITPAGAVSFGLLGSLTGWTASGTKAVGLATITYSL